MGRIFCLMGKSSSGKDTIYKRLLEDTSLSLRPLVPCTTRPIRDGETHGVEYYFYTEEELSRLEAAGKIIELRAYHTVQGLWKYFTADDSQIDLEHFSYLMIGTLESYLKLLDYFGKDKMIPLYLYLDDGDRLQRALDREKAQQDPGYAEMCRRFLADEEDFSQEKLAAAGISQQFLNKDSQKTAAELTKYLRSYLE